MIHEIIMMILFLGGGAFFWWVVTQPVMRIVGYTSSKYGSYFVQSDLDFISAITHYMPLFILIAALVMVLVSVQRTRPAGYYGRY